MIKVKPLTEEEILSKVVTIISSYLPDAAIYLFGSRASGNAKQNSDFDLAVEWKEKVPFSVIAKIREKLEELPTLKSFDLVDLKLCSGRFVRSVKEKGVILPTLTVDFRNAFYFR